MALSQLSDQELLAAFEHAHRYIDQLLKQPGHSYASVAAQIGITSSALKQFVRRGNLRDDGPVRRGAAFASIVRFVRESEGKGSAGDEGPSARDLQLLEQIDKLSYQSKVLVAYGAISSILRADGAKSAAAGEIMSGLYYCYRNATNETYLIKSMLQITKVPGFPDKNLYQFFHWHYDGNEVLKKSDGMFLSLADNAYLFGDVAEGAGIDYMVMPVPLSKDFFFIPGFQIAIDHKREPFFAKIFCIKQAWPEGAPEGEAPDALKERTGLVAKEDVRRAGIDGDRDLGARLLDHLVVSESDSLIRIESDKVVRRVLETP